ncbi:MAG TPA: sugar phosphate isomerase/epimerase family protein [Candidatus Limiplasma sp.]|nr:sugar phosphate isomerase/epimerase family protein [Candidatus Limiplasma sp.]HPS82469.1 sugar phosphate isomerase/epimerase family protein [Candidatus Limiplasma sp.]
MRRIIAANSNCYHGFSIEQAIDGIRRAGFHYIELTATKGWTEHVFPNMPFERLLAVQDALKAANLTPFAMSGHCNLMDPTRAADFEHNMRLAAFFGCAYIVSSIGEAHLKDQAVADIATVAARVAELVPQLETYGLTLVLETHGHDHGTGAILADVVRRVGSPRVRINYDTANVIFYGGVDPVTDFAACVADVGYLHLKDKAGKLTEWNFPALGEGSVDFPRIFDVLAKADNRSPLSVEIEFTQAGLKDLAEVDEAMLQSARYLKAQGFTL